MKGVAATLLALITSSLLYQMPYAETLDEMARRAAQKYKVDASLVCAIINQESRWRQNAVSHAGAIGLMQIMPITGKKACGLETIELYDPSQNINCGVYYFSEQLKRFGSVKLALCAYNAGPHRVKKYKACPPFKETMNYHRKILADWKAKKSCPRALKAGKPPKSIKKNNAHISAKGVADYRFIEGDFEPSEWWKLVCESLDVVYEREIAKTEPESVGKPATTPEQIKTWLSILNATVDDIYRDERRLKGSTAILRSIIEENIRNACPLKTDNPPQSSFKETKLSAKGIADGRFREGDFEPAEWWTLVCESVDVLYNIEIVKTEIESIGKPATTPEQIKTWLSILDATVDNIYKDEQRKKGSAAMSRSKIEENIRSACPGGRSDYQCSPHSGCSG